MNKHACPCGAPLMELWHSRTGVRAISNCGAHGYRPYADGKWRWTGCPDAPRNPIAYRPASHVVDEFLQGLTW